MKLPRLYNSEVFFVVVRRVVRRLCQLATQYRSGTLSQERQGSSAASIKQKEHFDSHNGM
jgi:hypothetical protein